MTGNSRKQAGRSGTADRIRRPQAGVFLYIPEQKSLPLFNQGTDDQR